MHTVLAKFTTPRAFTDLHEYAEILRPWPFNLLVNAEWASGSEPRSMGMRSIATYIHTFAKFQENTTILSYIHVQYTIEYTISEKTHCSVGITGYQYLHNYNYCLTR